MLVRWILILLSTCSNQKVAALPNASDHCSDFIRDSAIDSSESDQLIEGLQAYFMAYRKSEDLIFKKSDIEAVVNEPLRNTENLNNENLIKLLSYGEFGTLEMVWQHLGLLDVFMTRFPDTSLFWKQALSFVEVYKLLLADENYREPNRIDSEAQRNARLKSAIERSNKKLSRTLKNLR